MPVYREDIDNIIGVTRIRDLLPELARGELTQAILLERIREPHFVPEGTPLNEAALELPAASAPLGVRRRRVRRRPRADHDAGHLATRSSASSTATRAPVDLGVTKESDRSYVVDASANVRQLNRVMNWNLPTDGPKTLNGLIVEQLATIPESGTGVTVADYPIEILDTSEHGIKTRPRVRAGLRSAAEAAA